MKTRNALIISFVLSFMTIWITASMLEDGDVNAISMYFVVFFGPVLLVLLLNGIVLEIARKVQSVAIKRWFTSAPILILTVLTFPSYTPILGVDGSLSFLGMVGLVAVGITNVAWNLHLKVSE
jgi:hypothetical protein